MRPRLQVGGGRRGRSGHLTKTQASSELRLALGQGKGRTFSKSELGGLWEQHLLTIKVFNGKCHCLSTKGRVLATHSLGIISFDNG